MTKKTRVFILSALTSLLMLATYSIAAQEWQGPEHVLAAAKAGDAEAQLEMGILYEYGFFLSENKAPALAWYSLAAEQGNVKAAKLKQKLEASMSYEEIQEAEKLKPTLAVASPKPSVPAPDEPSAPETSPETEAPAAPETPEVSAEPLPENSQQSAPAADDGIPTIQ